VTVSRSDIALSLVLLAKAKPALYASAVETEWAKQAARAIKHLSLVLKNNPGKSVAEILQRPDVQQALHEPFQTAGKYTLGQVQLVWNEAKGPASSEYLDQLMSDVVRTSAVSSSLMQRTINEGDRESIVDRMKKLAASLALRNGLTIRVAEVRAITEHDLLEIAKSHSHKKWVSKNDDSTCSSCHGLHGMVIPILEEFPADVGDRPLHVYKDLLGPPRHPRCRCKLVPA